MPTIEMVPKHALSYKEFVRLSEQQRRGLGRVTIVPPELGEPGFGCIVTENPVFIHRAIRNTKLLVKRKR